MGDFDRAFNFTVRKWEAGGQADGGYVNHPDDPGGETKWGISARAHPGLDIRTLTEGQARSIYRERYWAKVRGDDLPPATALALFDWAVHSNLRRTVAPTFQRLVGAYPDGLIGPKTVAAARREAVNPLEDAALAARLVDARARYLVGIMSRGTPDPSDDRYRAFELGWVRRLVDLAGTAALEAVRPLRP